MNDRLFYTSGPYKTTEEIHYALTTELDKLSGTDWQLFCAGARKAVFCGIRRLCDSGCGGKTVYPAPENIFAAFRACPASSVRVVILGRTLP